jgi:ribosomal protein S12 methylthiotransferase accessory factor
VPIPSASRSGLLANERCLVSPLCGIVKECKRIHKDYSEPLLPYIFRAELANSLFLKSDSSKTSLVASGKGFTPEAARTSALGEAVERYSGSCWQPSQIRYARRDELPGRSLDPRDLVLYAADQYPTLRYAAYRDETVLGWVWGRTLGADGAIWLPAIGIFMSYDAREHSEFICPITSNGLAAGESLEQALSKAALEVIERDAFMLCWMNRLPALRVDVGDHPDRDLRELCAAYRRRGVEIELYRLPVDHSVPVLMALAVDSRSPGPAVVVGLGAHLDAAEAARAAVLETAQVRPALRIRMRSPEARERLKELLADPQRVTDLEDHDLLYASGRMQSAFDFVRTDAVEPGCWISDTCDSAETLARLCAAMCTIGKEIHYVDLTPPDMALLGLHTVRAIIPDFQPIHFGAGEPRLGGSRLFEIPRTLGIRTDRATVADLNPDPHPLS